MKGLKGIVFLLILVVIAPMLLLFAWIASVTEKRQGKTQARSRSKSQLKNLE